MFLTAKWCRGFGWWCRGRVEEWLSAERRPIYVSRRQSEATEVVAGTREKTGQIGTGETIGLILPIFEYVHG